MNRQTRQTRNTLRCKGCGEVVHCTVCGKGATGGTEFSDWFRSLGPETRMTSAHYDNQNLDFIWFAYREGWFILIEEKRYGTQSTAAQSDTHSVIDQLLIVSSGSVVKTLRGLRPIEYRGYYVVSFSKTNPDDSDCIWINGNEATRETLIELLETGRLGDLPATAPRHRIIPTPAAFAH